MSSDIDLSSLEFSQNPYSFYDSLRKNGNVHYVKKNSIWLITGYQTIIDILLNTEVFSSEGENTFDPILLNCDPPKHTLHRKILKGESGLFAQKRIQSIEDDNRNLSRLLLEKLKGKECFDVIHDYSQHFAALVILKHLKIEEVNQTFLNFTNQSVSTQSIYNRDFANEAWESIKPIVEKWVENAYKQKEEAGISEIIHHKDRPNYFEKENLVNLTKVLLVGGNETTPNLISSVLFILLRNKPLKDAVLNDIGLLEQVVHEVLRLESPTQIIHRRNKKAIEIEGHIIPKNSLIGLAIGAGNRDPDFFESPDEFLLGRNNSKILSFGFGAHHCIGASLAKQETIIAIQTLFEIFPELDISPNLQPIYGHSSHIRGFAAFPVYTHDRQKDFLQEKKTSARLVLEKALQQFNHFPTYEYYPDFDLKKDKLWHFTYPSPFIHANVLYALIQINDFSIQELVKQSEPFLLTVKETGDLWRFWDVQQCEHPIPCDIDDTAICSIVLNKLNHQLNNKSILKYNFKKNGRIPTWIKPDWKLMISQPTLFFSLQKNKEKIQQTFSMGMFDWEDEELGVKANLLAYMGESRLTKNAISVCISEWKSQTDKRQFYKDGVVVSYHIARAYKEGISEFGCLKKDFEEYIEKRVSNLDLTESLFAYLTLEYYHSDSHLKVFLKSQILNQIHVTDFSNQYYAYFTSKDRIFFAGSPCLTAALFLETIKDW